MWFGLPEPAHAEEMISRLADADHQTDWGMRIISSTLAPLRRLRLSLRLGVAAVHRMGLRRRIPLSSRISGLCQPAIQRFAASMVALATSPRFFPATTIRLSRPVRRIRSGRRRWWSVRFCAACSACRPMPRGTRSLWLRMCPHDWTSFSCPKYSHGQTAAVDFHYRKTPDSHHIAGNAHWIPRDCLVEFSPGIQLARRNCLGRNERKAACHSSIQAKQRRPACTDALPCHPTASPPSSFELKNDFGLRWRTATPAARRREPRLARNFELMECSATTN